MRKYWIIAGVFVLAILFVVVFYPRPAETVELHEPAVGEAYIPQAESYPKGAVGFAISYPQCGKEYPTDYDFGIVGVTNGYSLTKNPCLKSEIEWAREGKYDPAFYFNLSYPAPLREQTIKALGCAAQDEECLGYHFGYRTAKEAHEYAISQGAEPATWWIDLQLASSWSEEAAINAQVVLGAIAYFKEQGLPVGLSTTPYQWNEITGSLETGLPVWVPGREKEVVAQYCLTGKSYSGGQVRQLAYMENDFEAVYACGE